MTDYKSLGPERMCHRLEAIEALFTLNLFRGRSQFGIRQPIGFGGRAILVGAARQVHGFAHRPDLTGAGPRQHVGTENQQIPPSETDLYLQGIVAIVSFVHNFTMGQRFQLTRHPMEDYTSET